MPAGDDDSLLGHMAASDHKLVGFEKADDCSIA